MRIITLNVNGIRSAERKGFARWLARVEPWDVVCLQEIKAGARRRAARAARAAQVRTPRSTRRERKGYSGVAIYAKRAAARSSPASAAASSTPKAATSRRISRDADGHQPVPAVGVERAAPAGVEVPLPRRVPAASREAAQARARDHPVRRLEHRAPADRPQELAQQPEEFRLPARGARVADARVRRARLRRRVPHASTRGPSSTRGGRIAAQAWAKNVGWRIDYQIATPGIAATARAASIYTNRRFSDHAPLDHRLRLRAALTRVAARPRDAAPHQPHARARHQAPARRREPDRPRRAQGRPHRRRTAAASRASSR